MLELLYQLLAWLTQKHVTMGHPSVGVICLCYPRRWWPWGTASAYIEPADGDNIGWTLTSPLASELSQLVSAKSPVELAWRYKQIMARRASTERGGHLVGNMAGVPLSQEPPLTGRTPPREEQQNPE